MYGFDIEMGVSLEYILKINLVSNKDIRLLLALFQRRKYLPIMDLQQRKIYVLLAKNISTVEMLRAYFHAYVYGLIVCETLELSTVRINLNRVRYMIH